MDHDRKARLVYSKTSGLVPQYRRHSALAQVLYNVRSAPLSQEQQAAALQTKGAMQLTRSGRIFSKVWTSPLVPLGLCVGHLYFIALFLRNPFQKVELD